MKRPSPYRIFLHGSVFLFLSCTKTVEPPPPLTLKITSVFPLTGEVGQRITISGTGFDSLYWQNKVKFNGDVSTFIETGTLTSLVCRVPYGATSGPITITNSLGTLQGPDFVVEAPCDTPFCVQWNNLDSVTSESSLIRGWSQTPSSWQVTLSQDTVTLWHTGLCGDECNYVSQLTFVNQGNNTLPLFVRRNITVNDYYEPIQYDTSKYGIIRIQQWDLSKTIAGWFYGDWGMTMFWYDF